MLNLSLLYHLFHLSRALMDVVLLVLHIAGSKRFFHRNLVLI